MNPSPSAPADPGDAAGAETTSAPPRSQPGRGGPARMTIRSVSACEWMERAAPMLQAHWQEVALHKGLMVLKPDIEAYREMEAKGQLVSLGAFLGEQPIGYSINLLHKHLHYADLTVAQNDLLFVIPEHRKGLAGHLLIRWTERTVRAHGARLMLWHAKPGTALESLMPRLGYGVQDTLFSKPL
jgi:hypothetical protein